MRGSDRGGVMPAAGARQKVSYFTPTPGDGVAGVPPAQAGPLVAKDQVLEFVRNRILGGYYKAGQYLSESILQKHLLEANLDYVNGPLQFGVLYVQAGATSGSGTLLPTESNSEIAFGAKYQAGPVQPYFSYIRREATDPTRRAGGGIVNGNSESAKLFGVAIPVSQRGTVRMTYGLYASGAADSDARNYGIAYTYEVSRRLTLMTAVTHLSQDGAARYPVFQSPRPRAGESVDAVTAGLTWRF